MSQFHELWSNWDLIVGDLAQFAKPLGVRNRTLCIGVENNFELQELQFEYDDIFSRANAFMKSFGHESFFEKLELKLLQGLPPIEIKNFILPVTKTFLPERPKNIGSKIDFKDEIILEKCYQAYCERLDLEKNR